MSELCRKCKNRPCEYFGPVGPDDEGYTSPWARLVEHHSILPRYRLQPFARFPGGGHARFLVLPRKEWCEWRDAGKKYFDKVNADIAAGATRVQTRALCALPSPELPAGSVAPAPGELIEAAIEVADSVERSGQSTDWFPALVRLIKAKRAYTVSSPVAPAAPTPAEWAAKEHDEWASNCRHIAQKTREEWTGPDYSSEDNKANHAEAREYDRKAAYHEQSARHFREMGLAVSSPDSRPSPDRAVREALKEAIDVFAGMNDDEIDVELLPQLRAALSTAPQQGDEDRFDKIARSWGWIKLKRGWYHPSAEQYHGYVGFPVCYSTAREVCEAEGLSEPAPQQGGEPVTRPDEREIYCTTDGREWCQVRPRASRCPDCPTLSPPERGTP